MSVFTVKPLNDRTGFKNRPKRSPFDSPWSSTLDLLARELRHLGAKNVIVEVDTLPGSVRLDGQLYANAKVHSPAIRLHFDSKHGHLSYETDAFTSWQANVRAVALALEALRRVDRYQIGRGGDQYRGYLALEAGSGATALGGMTRDQALVLLRMHATGSDGIAPTDTSERALWRMAKARSHPDRHHGSQTAWDQVQQAAKVLGLTA